MKDGLGMSTNKKKSFAESIWYMIMRKNTADVDSVFFLLQNLRFLQVNNCHGGLREANLPGIMHQRCRPKW